MSKRGFLTGAGALIAGCTASRSGQSQVANTGACRWAAEPATFVLVHGAWCGGWVWDEVAHELRTAGHEVFAPTLTGLADRGHLLSSVLTHATHVRDVVNLIRWQELNDIVLVGHSYGGTVISAVASELPEGTIRSIVYLDAILTIAPSAEDADELATVNGFTMINGVPCIQPPRSEAGFQLRGAAAARADRLLTPMPLTAFPQAMPRIEAVEQIPIKTFVVATGNPEPLASVPESERLRQDPSWRVQTIDCAHMTMLLKPRETKDILENAV